MRACASKCARSKVGVPVSAGESVAEYDKIGAGYAAVRRPDPRLATIIEDALGDAATFLNVGAGSGSYESNDRDVTALEPALVMLAQHGGRRRVQGVAEAIPFPDAAFDAAMAILTVHHWTDLDAGLAELRRVARRQVVFTWDPEFHPELWIVSDYVPAIGVMERARFTSIDHVADVLRARTVRAFEIPHDFTDGFQAAYWRRPEAYLDPQTRAASSTFAVLPAEDVEPGIERLRRDLASGAWVRRHRELLTKETFDYGYRLIVAG
jgi:SAM-dependent methyltransferase